MRRVLLRSVAVLAIVVVALSAAVAWIVHTPAGLAWSLARVQGAVAGMVLQDATGTWADGVAIRHIAFDASDLKVSAEDVELVLSPWSVLLARPRITTLAARRLEIVMLPGESRTGAPDSLALPIDMDIASARVDELTVEREGHREVFTGAFVSYAGGKRQHELRELRAKHEMGRVQAKGILSARSPFPLSAEAHVTLDKPAPLGIDAQLGGTLTALSVQGEVRHAAATARVHALVTPFESVPVSNIDVAADDIDLRRFDAAMPRTQVSARVSLAP
ncbi:MAG TPA: hypothetical protein VNT02_15490, partial [Burkholderiales bacterium]|nr:hypothetical protein [Burkholderiales bacterium]